MDKRNYVYFPFISVKYRLIFHSKVYFCKIYVLKRVAVYKRLNTANFKLGHIKKPPHWEAFKC
jgi:hypothetical protein